MEGPLSKWTNVMKGWQYRWFVLDDNAGLLSYYTSRDKMMRGSRRGCVRLCSAIIGIDDEDNSTFTITVDQKIFHFQARDSEEREQWVSALEDTIARHSKRQFDYQASYATLEEFDNKIIEAEAYINILTRNAKAFERRINKSVDSMERQKYEGMQVTAMELVESVKQAVSLLQVARSTIGPQPDEVESHESIAISKNASKLERLHVSAGINGNDANHLHVNDVDVDACVNGIDLLVVENNESAQKQDSPIDSEPLEVNSIASNSYNTNEPDGFRSSPVDPLKPSPSPISQGAGCTPTHVPCISYSSSDEEDDEFYDADEDVDTTAVANNLVKEIPPSKSEAVITGNEDTPQSSTVQVRDKLEDLYMKEEEHNDKDGDSVEEHKSVIMHLLSQVKLGMDLTKVVLPTFILERRSLLEMYADFFAHPDIFVSIADGATAESRMINCLQWYLSSFHAGRKGSVAKKPYNPIIGEMFQCFYNLPDVPPDEYIVCDGPVPWAHRNHVTFLAEQVSHHPPISAFYAEHVNKRIQFNAHIWTKSKFLGLSIGVHNLGQGCVRLIDSGEEYIMNFPNGYGRSILTVPWIELGGECNITCEQTGYSANVTFHTKPFYGGKVHRVTAEVMAPNEKKPVMTIEGEWNGCMNVKSKVDKKSCFIDTKKMKTSHKVVKKIEHQGDMESRKLWKDVTYNLKHNNIDEATNSKKKLEEKQRQDAKYRLENNIKYKTIQFEEDDSGNWIYKSSLNNRI